MTLFDLAGLRNKLEEINRKTEEEGFWNDQERAQKLLKDLDKNNEFLYLLIEKLVNRRK